jgi:ethanolamine utilization protein EutA
MLFLKYSAGKRRTNEREVEENAYGDLGPMLGKTIRGSQLCGGPYVIAGKAIRSTVIGAGCHATMLSGSTVFAQNVDLPLKNLPVAVLTEQEQEVLPAVISQKRRAFEATPVLALPGYESPSYGQIRALAKTLAQACPEGVYVCLQQDMAMALGNALSLLLPPPIPILCLDGLAPTGQCYLDVGVPVGPCIPVVIKTLVFERGNL